MRHVLFVLAVVTAMGCSQEPRDAGAQAEREPPTAAPGPADPVPVSLLAEGQYCNLDRGWRRIGAGDDLPQNLPRVDLGDDGILLLISMGTRPTGGYGITVPAQAPMEDGEVRLQVEFQVPAPDALVTQALTSPCVLVALPVPTETPVEVSFSGPGA